MKKDLFLFFCVLVLHLLYLALVKVKVKINTILFDFQSSDPLCLDPQIAVGTPANIVINNCFEGLFELAKRKYYSRCCKVGLFLLTLLHTSLNCVQIQNGFCQRFRKHTRRRL